MTRLHIKNHGSAMCGRRDVLNFAGEDVDALFASQLAGEGEPLCRACFKKRRGYENSRRANVAIKAFIEARARGER